MKRKRLLTLLGSVCLAVMLLVPLAVSCGPATPEAAEEEIAALESEIDELEAGVAAKDAEISDLEEEIAALKAPAEEEVINIDLTSWASSGWGYKVNDLWVEYVDECSDGRIKIRYLPGGSVAPVAEHLDALIDGVFDMAFLWECIYGGQVPAFELLGRANALYTAYDCHNLATIGGWSELAERLYADLGLAHVTRWGHCDSMIFGTAPLRGLDDLKGLKMRIGSRRTANVFDSFGTESIVMAQDEVFLALSTGLLDVACLGTPAGVYDMGFQDIAKHWAPDMMQYSFVTIGANEDFWNTLSLADRALLEKTHLVAATDLRSGEVYADRLILEEVVRENGVTVYPWSKEDLKAYKDRTSELDLQFPEDPGWVEARDLLQEFLEDMGQD